MSFAKLLSLISHLVRNIRKIISKTPSTHFFLFKTIGSFSFSNQKPKFILRKTFTKDVFVIGTVETRKLERISKSSYFQNILIQINFNFYMNYYTVYYFKLNI